MGGWDVEGCELVSGIVKDASIEEHGLVIGILKDESVGVRY